MQIEKVRAYEILDSRGYPTVEVEISVEGGGVFTGSSPSGASCGSYECIELRDKDNNRYLGKGVLKAIKNINQIIGPALIGIDCKAQRQIDNLLKELDGTEQKKRLGANATTAVSITVAKAAAYLEKLPLYKYIGKLAKINEYNLPIPQMNIINGGEHAGIKNDIQEHLIIPVGFSSFKEGLRCCAEVYLKLKELLKEKFGPRGIQVGDEGGFVPPVDNVYERLKLITEVINTLGYGAAVKLGLDAAASEFYYKDKGKYIISDKEYSSFELVNFYEKLVEEFNILSIEDGMAEDDWLGWDKLNKTLGKYIKIIGDDLFTTNINRIKKGIELDVANGVIIKVNQIGTVSEAIDAVILAKSCGWDIIVSHRSGETEDTFIADLSVGLSAEFCKFGAPARTDRTAKYNRLLKIEELIEYDIKRGL